MKILLLGGSGFIGSHLAEKLEGHEVISTYHSHSPSSSSKYVKLDLLDADSFGDTLEDKDMIIFLAGQITKNKEYFRRLNTEGVKNFFEQVLKLKKMPRIIFASTSYVYGEVEDAKETDKPMPADEYGEVKYEAEKVFQKMAKKIPTCILRISNVYGPGKGMGVISRFVRAVKQNEPFALDNKGNYLRDFIHVDDVTDAFVKAVGKDVTGIFNVCSGETHTVAEVVKIIKKIAKKEIKITPTTTAKKIMKKNTVSNKKAKQLLGFEARIKLEKGIRQLLE